MNNTYNDAYFENLTKEANVIYRCLYLNEINNNLKDAINSYLDVYFDAYKKYVNLVQKNDVVTKIFNTLTYVDFLLGSFGTIIFAPFA